MLVELSASPSVGHAKRWSAAIAGLLLLLGCTQSASHIETMATPPVSVEEATLKEWLSAYNDNDPASFERFAAARYSKKELAERDAATIANGAHNWHFNYGPMRLAARPSIKPGEAEVVVYTAGVDACARLYVEADSIEKDKIGGVYLSPFAHAECRERVTKVRSLREFAVQTRKYLDELATSGRFSGAVLITQGGRPLVSEARGLARREPPVRNSTDMRFELASVSKMFTAVAIARLVEQGRLSYDATVGDVLPQFPGTPPMRRITVRQLLSHTSGLSDYYRNGAIFADYRVRHKLSEYWPLFASHPLAFEPGAEYDYSNSNYVLLGSIVEQVSGMPFAAFVQREVFDRAGMKSSCYCTPGAVLSARPRSKHTTLAGPTRKPIREGWITVPDDWPRPAIPAGHSMSTAEDLTRFMRALLEGRLVSQATLAQMRRPVMEMDDGGKMGLGLFLYDVGGSEAFGHSGNSWGVGTQVETYPVLDVIVVILSNSQTAGTGALRYKTREWLASLAAQRDLSTAGPPSSARK